MSLCLMYTMRPILLISYHLISFIHHFCKNGHDKYAPCTPFGWSDLNNTGAYDAPYTLQLCPERVASEVATYWVQFRSNQKRHFVVNFGPVFWYPEFDAPCTPYITPKHNTCNSGRLSSPISFPNAVIKISSCDLAFVCRGLKSDQKRTKIVHRPL